MSLYSCFTRTSSIWSPLTIRLGVGAIMFYHGAQKLFGWFGGSGLEATATSFADNLDLHPGMLMAVLAGGVETFGGVLLIIGFLTRPAALGIAITMGVAIYAAEMYGSLGGMEFPLLILLASISIIVSGAGRLSIDYSKRN